MAKHIGGGLKVKSNTILASIGPSDLLLLCWILSGIPLELEFYFWERVLSFISYSPESAFFLLQKNKIGSPRSPPLFCPWNGYCIF